MKNRDSGTHVSPLSGRFETALTIAALLHAPSWIGAGHIVATSFGPEVEREANAHVRLTGE